MSYVVMGQNEPATARSNLDARVRDLERIYRARLAELRRVAAAVSGSRQAAPDLVQEAFVRALREIGRFRGDGLIEGWLWRIVVNVALNYRRDGRAMTALGAEELAVAAAEPVERQPVADAVRALPERQRLVLFLRYYADLEYEAIAEALDISSGTVGATLTAARSSLSQALAVKEVTQ